MKTERRPVGPAIQPRDERLFWGLLESRVLTREQLAGLYFDGSYEMAKKRLAKLTRAGYIVERKPRANPGHYFPSLLSLGRKGFAALVASGQLAAFPKMTWDHFVDRVALAQTTLAHEVELIDHKVALARAVHAHPTLRIDEFLTWPTLFQFETEELESKKRFTLKPDAFVLVADGDDAEHSCFVEYDRAKEAGRHLMKKAWGYHRFYIDGGFAHRSGAPRDAFKAHPFRVLYVFPSEERRNVIAERLLQIHRPVDAEQRMPALVKNQHWLTTRAAHLANPLGPIWLTLDEYWRATEGTTYDPRHHFTMKRTSARDRLVALRAGLRPLFAFGDQAMTVKQQREVPICAP